MTNDYFVFVRRIVKKIDCASPLKWIILGVNLAIASGGQGNAIAQNVPAKEIPFPATEIINNGAAPLQTENETEVVKETQIPPVPTEKVAMGNGDSGYQEKNGKSGMGTSEHSPASLTSNLSAPTSQETFSDLNSPIALDVENGSPPLPINQVTPVSELQLSDVKPTEANSQNLDSSLEREIDAEDGLIEQGMEQITSVSQLSDVRPTDWAYQALANLVQRYGCIVGYPDSTYRGNRAMTRYEFAAGLNACLNRISEIIGSSRGGGVNTGDLDSIRKLQAEFTTELSTLQAKTDGLEERIAFQENHQFSTTTTLSGLVEMSLIGGFGDKKAVPSGQNPSQDLELNTVFAGLSFISFNTSFTGRDLLNVTKAAGGVNDFGTFATGTDMTALAFGLDNDNDIFEGGIFYRSPLGDNGVVQVGTSGVSAGSVMPSLNPAISISRFGGSSPIYGLANGGGIAMNYRFSEKLAAGFKYGGDTGGIANPLSGLFNGQYGAFTQVTFTPSTNFGIAFNYARYYSKTPNLTGFTGSEFAQTPFGTPFGKNPPTSANAFSLQSQFRFATSFSMGAWVEYIDAKAESAYSVNGVSGRKGDKAESWNWAITAALQDVGKRGSQLGFVFGMPPKLTNNDFSSREDKDTSYHIEAFYRYRYSDRIFITPSVLLITNPEHNNNNNDIWILSLRTSFIF